MMFKVPYEGLLSDGLLRKHLSVSRPQPFNDGM